MSTTRVPFIDLGRLVRTVRDPVVDDFAGIIDRCEFVGGPTVKKLEERLAALLGSANVVSCANGTDALIAGLEAFELPPGSKIALPNLTFWATYEAIVQAGHVPVLVDVDPVDLQMSFDQFRSAWNEHRFAGAILPHLYGWASARLREFRAFCKEQGIRLLEDGAQCFGVEAFGEPVLAGAEIATLSFYPAKVVGGAMDGGAVLARDKHTADLVRSLCNHGRSSHYSYSHVGWNSRMGGLQAAFISRILDQLPFVLESRRAAMEHYRAFAAEHRDAIDFVAPPDGIVGNGYLATFLAKGTTGEELAKALAERGIGAARTYPETMDQQPPASGAIRAGDLSTSRSICARVVNLPLFAGITLDECRLATDALAQILAAR
jgi:dTDP-4-amino-4,6-dideoxygalactose transaminase